MAVSVSDAVAALRLQPLVHVDDMAAAVDFYRGLGAELIHGSRDDDWTLLRLGGTEVGLLAHPPNPEQGDGAVELNLVSPGPLDDVADALRAAGVDVPDGPVDTFFGRQLQVTAPDGLLVKINELHVERLA